MSGYLLKTVIVSVQLLHLGTIVSEHSSIRLVRAQTCLRTNVSSWTQTCLGTAMWSQLYEHNHVWAQSWWNLLVTNYSTAIVTKLYHNMSVHVRNRNHEICRYICHAKGHERYISKFQIRIVFGQTILNTESRFFGPSYSEHRVPLFRPKLLCAGQTRVINFLFDTPD